jgi:two-component system KDP operon response regulator KdpE
MKRVLVIDDDSQIRRLLVLSLGKKDCEVFEAGTGFEGLQQVQACRPDIILLDLNLPDRDGAAVLAELRGWSGIPVIILSVRDSESDIVQLLNGGADDYLVKPFNTEELLARMNVVLRRIRPQSDVSVFQDGPLSIDWDQRQVAISGTPVKLTPTEYSILSLLARHHGRIVTYDFILKELWGALSEEEGGSLRVHMAAIRKKLGSAGPRLIITEPGIGYRLL